MTAARRAVARRGKGKGVAATVIVAALGYFVDIYDLVLFSIVRVPSLKALGLQGDAVLSTGVFLINAQMTGMLVGGVLWGILGDKKGRLSVLFGSIFMYSMANIANAFVTDVASYSVLRFLAGVGLAGELGAAITLISEIMTKENRGYGTAIVATVGVSGAVVAALVGDHFTWKTAYIVGGCLGLALLVLRMGIFESGMFENLKGVDIRRGDLRLLLGHPQRLRKYLCCILVGIPIWYIIGVLVTFSPEITAAQGVTAPVSAGTAIMMCYIGLIAGDLAFGLLSQFWRTRQKVILLSLVISALAIALDLSLRGFHPSTFYAVCVLLGLAAGYWAVFMTVASEQFGTNLRATVTTTAPNFVRGSVVPLTLSFQALKGSLGIVGSAAAIGVVVLVIALFAATYLEETFGKDLDYVER